MAMFMLHLKCAVQHNPEVVWIFSSILQYMCVARPQTTRTSKMILEKQSPLLLFTWDQNMYQEKKNYLW